MRSVEEAKTRMWVTLDTEIAGMGISETLAEVLHDVGIRYLGELAMYTDGTLVEKTKCLGGLKPQEAVAVLYHFDTLLVGHLLKWGMTPEETYGWVPPPGRKTEGAPA